MAEPAESPIYGPASLHNDEAFPVRQLLDHAMRHAVEVAPLLTVLGREGDVEEGQTQAGPHLLAFVQRQQGVAILHVGPHDGQPQHVPRGVDRHDAFASDQLLNSVVATRPAHPASSSPFPENAGGF